MFGDLKSFRVHPSQYDFCLNFDLWNLFLFGMSFFIVGITCPSGERPNQGEQYAAAEEYHQEALAFTKEKIMHREVEITVESCNKGGSMIGWLFVGNINLSLALVKEGLAKVHRSAERSEYFKLLQQAEKEAKDKKLNVIKN